MLDLHHIKVIQILVSVTVYFYVFFEEEMIGLTFMEKKVTILKVGNLTLEDLLAKSTEAFLKHTAYICFRFHNSFHYKDCIKMQQNVFNH